MILTATWVCRPNRDDSCWCSGCRNQDIFPCSIVKDGTGAPVGQLLTLPHVPSRMSPTSFLPPPHSSQRLLAIGKGSRNDSSPRAEVFLKEKKKKRGQGEDFYVVVIHWFGVTVARGALVQVFPGVASAVRLLMESAKCSNFLCQASISPWGYSSHLPPQHPGGG